MDKLALGNLISGYLGNAVQPIIKHTLTDYLWEKIRVALDEAEDRGYDRGKNDGWREAEEALY